MGLTKILNNNSIIELFSWGRMGALLLYNDIYLAVSPGFSCANLIYTRTHAGEFFPQYTMNTHPLHLGVIFSNTSMTTQ